ncbi:hypothetical protein [Kitasatospora sp. NPDC058218]|uniref:hypothetical protein n=1 Tax=Kitasatospora sp. NPDC058218 TaxID=3346385 RepID=UPI0036DC2118
MGAAPSRAGWGRRGPPRNAAIEGDTAAVDEFSRTWLGTSRPERWREAVEAALLGDWTTTLGTGTGTATDDTITDLLKHQAGTEHRHLQPLWERRVRGKRTALLGERVGVDQVLADLLTEHRTPETEALAAELSDSRLLAVLRDLKPDEDAFARSWASSRETWAQAALEAGLPTAFAERVRRKLKRLGNQHTTRTLSAVIR